MASEPCPLTGAERAMCRLVHCGPRPQAMLRPLHLELQVYVDKTRTKQKHRYCLKTEKVMICDDFVSWQARFCKPNDFGEHTDFRSGQVEKIRQEDQVVNINDC